MNPLEPRLPPQGDRRQTARLPYFAEARVVGTAETYFHPTRNLSLGGVFLKTEFPLPVGTKLRIDLRDPSGAPFTVRGLVAWCQEGARPGTPEALAEPPIEAGMGVQFVTLEADETAKLREVVAGLSGES